MNNMKNIAKRRVAQLDFFSLIPFRKFDFTDSKLSLREKKAHTKFTEIHIFCR